MNRSLCFCLTLLLTLLPKLCTAQSPTNEYYELLQYQGVPESRVAELDQYLEKALVPALTRMGIKNIGVFQESQFTDGKTSFYLLMTLKGPNQTMEIREKLKSDSLFLAAAESYLRTDPKQPIYSRMRSELLVAFDCQPKLAVPKQKAENADRLFELRVYESANELKGITKVDMFNQGEVPIFLDCGIQPVFFGQAIVGDHLPNLTYMTVHNSPEERDAAWAKFMRHPDWKKLSSMEKYQNTVSKVIKIDLKPRPYSQL